MRDLRLVQAIHHQRTTAAAAKHLGMTQSGVSHQLRNLEERLGVEVFDRKGRSLCLSEAGTKMLRAGDDILEAVRALESDLRRGSEAPLTLRVATQCHTVYGWLPRATVEMRRRGAPLLIKPVTTASRSASDALLEGEVDLALLLEPSRDLRLCQRRLFDDELVLLIAPDHPLAGRGWVKGEDLFDEDLLMLEVSKESGQRVGRALFPRGGGFRSVTHMALTEAIVEMVKAGLGVTILPAWSVSPHISRGELAALRLHKAGLQRKWVAAYRRDSKKVAPIRELLAILKQQPGLPGGGRVVPPTMPSTE